MSTNEDSAWDAMVPSTSQAQQNKGLVQFSLHGPLKSDIDDSTWQDVPDLITNVKLETICEEVSKFTWPTKVMKEDTMIL